MTSPARAYAGFDASSPLRPFAFQRRDVGVTDIQFDILYCGVCHSDLHTVKSEWSGTLYPCVPGHEIVGRVSAVGANVRNFKVGDLAGVGCMVDSCRTCAACSEGEEQFCDRHETTYTYNSDDRHGAGPTTYGGYSSHIVVDEAFCLRIPANLQLAAVAPLLCAGITTYSPLRHWNAGPATRVGVVGLGGLGHMAVKLAHSLGAETVLFTSSPEKVADGKRLGADHVVVTSDRQEMKQQKESLDLIIDTVATSHDLDMFLATLRRNGTHVLVGVPEQANTGPSASMLIGKRRRVAGSLIGGIRETQEMLDYCGKQNIVSDVEIIAMSQINEAYQRMLARDVRYRFVIDMSTLTA